MTQSTPRTAPAPLDDLHRTMAGYVERDEVPGVVTGIAHGAETHVDAIGVRTVGSAAPVRRDTIFRISSMTKPVTAAAAMVLVEEGKLALDEPVDRLLPELRDRKVLRRIDGPIDDVVPARRSITVRDLLTFRLGFGTVLVPPDTYPIQKAVNDAGLPTLGPPQPSAAPPPDEWMRRFATLPLMAQPGERWMYNTGVHVLGVLIARAARRPLDVFLHERLFEPLGMKDTAFSVPAGKLDRFVTSYRIDRDQQLVENDPIAGDWSRPPAFPDGAAGLVSTVDDFLSFGRMMLAGGTHGGVRILSSSSVAVMTTDQLTPEQKAASDFVPGFWQTRGWGLGMCVVHRRDATSPGGFGWDGGLGTSWYSDPKAGLVGVLMTQRMWTSPSPPDVNHDFWERVYRSIEG